MRIVLEREEKDILLLFIAHNTGFFMDLKPPNGFFL